MKEHSVRFYQPWIVVILGLSHLKLVEEYDKFYGI